MVILITGASRGIGREIAITLSKEGHKIIANYNKSEEQAKELEKQNTNIEIFKADVSKRNEVQNMVQEIIKKYGKIDVLINNAGISENKLFTNVTDEDWNRMINTNLYSAFCVSQKVIPYMIHEKNGCIINISSIWGVEGGSCEVHYSTAKAGIIGLTKALAKEVGPSNIRVNCIAPGMIDTDMNKEYSKEDVQEIINETPLGKIGRPIDIARCAYWLIEDEFTTGQVISINGGWN